MALETEWHIYFGTVRAQKMLTIKLVCSLAANLSHFNAKAVQ